MLKEELRRIRPDLLYKRPIIRHASCTAVHQGGRRSRVEIRSTLSWEGFKVVPETLMLIDDVITAGAHFKVCQRMIRENHQAMQIVGVFWARVVWKEPQPCQ